MADVPDSPPMGSRKKGVIRHARNPFLDSLVLETKKKFSRQEAGVFMTGNAMRNRTGEHVETAEITRVTMVDKAKFVKIYIQELRHFFDLKPSTQKVLQVVLTELQKRKDRDLVYLDYRHAIEYFTGTGEAATGSPIMSKPTFHTCLRELIDKEFIAESTYQNQYFINPRLFFNGDRIRLVREYRVRNEEQGELPLEFHEDEKESAA